MASSESQSIGYVRANYHYNVPEAIIRLCLKYFDQNFTIQFSGINLQRFLSEKAGKCYQYKIKFNQDLSFIFAVIPNDDANSINARVCLK